MMQPSDNWVSAGEVCDRWPFDLGRNAVKVENVLSAQGWGGGTPTPPRHPPQLPEHGKQFQTSAYKILAWF